MTHTYRLHSFAPSPGVLRWECGQCRRVVHQDEAGRIVVLTPGLDAFAHVGREGRWCIFDEPETAPLDGVWAAWRE
jgi:hypothetical protein